jgi:hypothetical protein
MGITLSVTDKEKASKNLEAYFLKLAINGQKID